MWRRVQEEPLELTLAVIALVAAVLNLGTRYSDMTVFTVMFYVALIPGAVLTIIGRLRDTLDIESAGLALLLGGYAFASLRGLARAHDAGTVTAVIINGGALVIGLAIRLVVVRKATHARSLAGEELRTRE